MLRLKFRVDKIKPSTNGNAIYLSPVYDVDPTSENGKFYAQTPGGTIILMTVYPAKTDLFVEGRDYYIDFTPAPASTG